MFTATRYPGIGHRGGEVVGEIDRGLLVLVGVEPEDAEQTVIRMAERLLHCRVFADAEGKMNLNVAGQTAQSCWCRNLRWPPIPLGVTGRVSTAAPPDQASRLCDALAEALRKGDVLVEQAASAPMKVALVNDGPVTFLLEVDCQAAIVG